MARTLTFPANGGRVEAAASWPPRRTSMSDPIGRKQYADAFETRLN